MKKDEETICPQCNIGYLWLDEYSDWIWICTNNDCDYKTKATNDEITEYYNNEE